MSKYKLGATIMIVSALMTSFGQLFWKLSNGQLCLYLILGFLLYGIGAVLLIFAFSLGDLSKLHPLLSVSYVVSIVLGYVVLGESLSLLKFTGLAIIIVGLYLVTSSEKTI